MLTRRKLLGGLIAFISAPAIIKVAGIMPIRAYNPGVILIDDPLYISATEIEALTERQAAMIAANLEYRHLIEAGVRRWWKQAFEDLQASPNRYIAQIVG